MKFFIDSADLLQIRHWVRNRVAVGVTTNPIIMARSGIRDVLGHVAEIASITRGLPLSVQVSRADPETIEREAQAYRAISDDIVIKVPIVSPSGESMLDSIARLSEAGIPVNATGCMSALQAIMAASAGARYASLLADRIADEGADTHRQIELTRHWMDEVESPAEVIIGSLRSPGSIYRVIRARPHIVTVPPEILAKSADHSYARRTVAEMEGSSG